MKLAVSYFLVRLITKQISFRKMHSFSDFARCCKQFYSKNKAPFSCVKVSLLAKKSQIVCKIKKPNLDLYATCQLHITHGFKKIVDYKTRYNVFVEKLDAKVWIFKNWKNRNLVSSSVTFWFWWMSRHGGAFPPRTNILDTNLQTPENIPLIHMQPVIAQEIPKKEAI